MASPRQLAYKDRFVWHLEEIISSIFEDCDDFTDRYVFPDMTTRVPMVMYLSQEQFTTLYSAVMSGADLTYPNSSHDVEYLFLQMVMCPMSQLCTAIADCLLTSEATRNALNQALAEMGLTGGVGDPSEPLDSAITGANLLPVGYVCTDDSAFGMALAVVNSINEATTEVLQAIEILTNPVEIASELGDNIPGVGALGSAGDIARWIQDAAQEAYELAWSVVIRDELACLLWCSFKGDCELSFDTIWDVYLGEAGAPPPPGVLLTEWLTWLVALPFTASLSTVATISLLGLLAIRYGGSFGDFALGLQSLETVIDLAQDDTSSDWSTVCDPCVPTWCYEFDFAVASYWTAGGRDVTPPDIATAAYGAGSWWRNKQFIPGSGANLTLAFHIPVPAGTVITLVEVEDEVTGTSSFEGWSVVDRLIDTETAIVIVSDPPKGNPHARETRQYPVDYTLVHTSVMIQSGGGASAPLSTDIATYRVRLSGTGTDPMLSGVAC